MKPLLTFSLLLLALVGLAAPPAGPTWTGKLIDTGGSQLHSSNLVDAVNMPSPLVLLSTNNGAAVTNVQVGITPFRVPTRLIFFGASLTGDAGTPFLSGHATYPFFLTNNFLNMTNVAFVQVLATVGGTLSSLSNTWWSAIVSNAPSGGTNAVLFHWGTLNDVWNNSSGLSDIMSNQWSLAAAMGYKVVTLTLLDLPATRTNTVGISGGNLAAEQRRQALNSYIRLATNYTRLVDADSLLTDYLSTTYDGGHTTTNAAMALAKEVARSLNASGPVQAVSQNGVLGQNLNGGLDLLGPLTASTSVNTTNFTNSGISSLLSGGHVFDLVPNGAGGILDLKRDAGGAAYFRASRLYGTYFGDFGTMTNGSSSDGVHFTKLPTNSPTDGQSIIATGTAGDTKFGTVTGTGTIDGTSPTFSSVTVTNGITSISLLDDTHTENFGHLAGVPTVTGLGAQDSANFGYQAGYGGTNEQFSLLAGFQAGAFSDNFYASVGLGYHAFGGSSNVVSSVALGYGAGNGSGGVSTSAIIGVHAGEQSPGMVDVELMGYHAGDQSPGLSYGIALGDRAGEGITNIIGFLFLGDKQSESTNYAISIDSMGGIDSTHVNGGAMIGGNFNDRTFLVRGSIDASNQVSTPKVIAGSLSASNNISTAGQMTAAGFQSPTNLFSGITFILGANYSLACSTNLNFTGVGGTANSTNYLYGELTVKATGDVVVTNPPSWFCNDGLTSRTLTNGNLGEMSMKVVPGFSTNFVFTQHWHP